jgi:hypothetical protein
MSIIKLDSSHHENSIEIFEDNTLISNDLIVRAGQLSISATFEQWTLSVDTMSGEPNSEYGSLSISHHGESRPFSVFSNITLTLEEVDKIREALPTLTFIDYREGVQHG